MKWADGYHPELLLNKLDRIKTIENGKVSFVAFEYLEYSNVLESMVELSPDITSDIKRDILSVAINNTAAKRTITKISLEKEIRKEEGKYLRKKKKDYILVTSISVPSSDRIPNMRINNCLLTFPGRLHKSFVMERYEKEDTVFKWYGGKKPLNHKPVKIHLQARNEREAASVALDQIDLIRGIWNLFLNDSMRMSSGKPMPVNKVLLGPVHTLHLASKKLATDMFWYEPDYRDYVPCTTLSSYKYKVLGSMRFVRERLNKIEYSDNLEEALRRYARALDHLDLTSSFIKMWGLLEYLTCTMKDSYKVTIRRASFLFQESEFHSQVLNHLKEYRNKTVHSGFNDSGKIEAYLYQLQKYVRQLLIFHLSNQIGVNTMSELVKFLDFPTDGKLLKEKKRLITKAIKFHS